MSLTLHSMLQERSREIFSQNQILDYINSHPEALRIRDADCFLPIHIEIRVNCRPAILARCIELYPKSLTKQDSYGHLALHHLLYSKTSSTEIALMMIERYPEALIQCDQFGRYPICYECSEQCRSIILSQCIKRYPELLSYRTYNGYLPLHKVLMNKSSSIEVAMMLINAYPEALIKEDHNDNFPHHIECLMRCRPSILMKCIELYPDSFGNKSISMIGLKVNRSNFHEYSSILSMIFTIRPECLYQDSIYASDARKDPYFRRSVLNLLPRHVFTLNHLTDFRNLNWQARSSLIFLLSMLQLSPVKALKEYSWATHYIGRKSNQDDHWRLLLFRIIKKSSLKSHAVDPDKRLQFCRDQDIGDIWLRSIVTFL